MSAACRPATVADEQRVTSPDRIEHNLQASAPGQRLVQDITYLNTAQGWLHLATVIDLATRMVVGWQIADHLRTNLVTDALAMSMTGGQAPTPVFHSERGCQYISAPWRHRTAGEDDRHDHGVELHDAACGVSHTRRA